MMAIDMKDPWQRPPFWANGVVDKATAQRAKFDELAALRREMLELDPERNRTRFYQLQKKLNRLERELKLTQTTGGVGMDPTPAPGCACEPTRRGTTIGMRCTRCGKVKRG